MTDPQAGDTLESAIAIVGMAGRFPGARNIAEYWRNLREGVESIVRYGDAELKAAGVPASLLAHPDYVKAGAPLDGMELFDAGFFGFSPLDASIMDPQHRHFLECCWEALERAGHDPARFGGAIGVFAGSGHNAYFPYNLLTNPELVQQVGFFLLRHTGNDKDFLATRVSYQLDLRGPSVNIQTACSTSLVAIHAGCQSLLSAECDLALAGGVTIELPHRQGYLYRDGEILAPDAHCRAFDAKSQGTVFGSGVGVVVLRRLADALRDGDDVLAVIRGSAVNNDGAGKVGYLAPSVDGQAAAVAEALAVAGVDPAEISYVEMHGTGTALGDPIEVAALARAFRKGTDRKGYCAIGSVKPNIGHLDTAAGVASVIKTVEALRHREIPPSLHYAAPNPEIDFESSPFFVNAKLRDWTSPQGAPADAPLRAGVSSLGVGGTNAHLVLEQAPARPAAGASREHQLLLLSARSENSLERASERLADHLRAHPELPLADVAHTLRVGRRAFERRRMLVVRDREQAIAELESGDPKRLPTSQVTHARRQVAFLFPGGGAQYPNMGRGLYESEPVYRRALDEGLALLEPAHRSEIHALLFAQPGALEAAAHTFERPSLQLPALFLVEMALAALWRSWGIEPSALIGHSMGENTAACLAGVFRLEDALALVTLRGRLFERVPPGAMLSIPLAAEQVEPLLGSELSLASINAPELCAASGPIEAIERLERELAGREIETRRVRIEIAAHSAMLDPILPEWRAFLRGLRLAKPKIPFVSNLTGSWIRDDEATDPEYWVRHLRGSVRFADGVAALCEDPDRLLLEVGPGRTLATLAKLHPARRADQDALNSLRHPDENESDAAFVLGVLGRLWLAGAQPDWAGFSRGEQRRRVELPSYAWDHQRHWVEPGTQLYAEGIGDPATRRRDDVGEWFTTPEWRRAPLAPAAAPDAPQRVLVLGAGTPHGERICALLRERGHTLLRVDEGPAFAARADARFTLRVDAADDYEALLEALASAGGPPSQIVHLWNLGDAPAGYERARALAFDSLLALAQAIGRQDLASPLRLDVVASGVQAIAGESVDAPLRALLLGPCRVIPRELANVRCRAIDVPPVPREAAAVARWSERLVTELGTDAPETTVALRGHERFVQHHEPRRLAEPTASGPTRLRRGGVYLVTGGLGGLGLALAQHLASAWGARLALVGRHALPPRAEWPAWLAAHPESDRVSRRLRAVEALEQAGAEVLVAEADVLDAPALSRAIAATQARFGALHGVFHAAGVLDDALLETKDAAAAERVLAPKVRGTLALDAALAGTPLDFLVLYSSVSAIAGLPGQIDYTAANAFLDAFAEHRSAREASPTLSVAWGAWQEVGIAAELARRAGGAEPAVLGPAPAHPLLERCLRDEDTQQIYASTFAPATHWLLDEHRVASGLALIPGTGFLELARAALCERPAGDAIEIRDTFLMAPFAVSDGASRELRIEIDRTSGDFSIASGAEGGERTEHVRGTALWVAADSPDKRSLAELRARCRERTLTFDGAVPQSHLRFGPRWSCVRSIAFGAGEAVAELALPEAFAGDLPAFGLHPALLDMATGCAHALIPGFEAARDFYVPISYARVLSRGPLPARVTSHIRHREDHRSGRDFAIFDVTLFDEAGLPVVEIEEFMLKRIADPTALAAAPTEAVVAAVAGAGAAGANPLLENLHDAIRPPEGLAALERILAAGAFPQIAVSPQPLLAWIAKLTAAPEARAKSRDAAPALDPQLLAALAEIEAVLREHPAVAAAAVTAHFDRPGERRLLAHVVWHTDQHATVSELRRFLRAKLSEDRVPQNIVELEALPLDANGNVDRAQLHDPFGVADDYKAPRSETEKTIAKTWQEVLGIDRVGLHDNFFDVGGHSLLAMRVIVRTEKKLGVRLNNAIMVLQTLEQVAAECDKRLGAARPAAATTAAPVAEEPAREGLSARLLRAVKRGAAQG